MKTAHAKSCEFPTLWGEGLLAMVDRVEKLSEASNYVPPLEKIIEIAKLVADLNGIPYKKYAVKNDKKTWLKYPQKVKWPEELKTCEDVHINVLVQANNLTEQVKQTMRKTIGIFVKQRLKHYSHVIYRPVVDFNGNGTYGLTLSYQLSAEQPKYTGKYCVGSAQLTKVGVVSPDRSLFHQLCNSVDAGEEVRIFVSPWFNNGDNIGELLWEYIVEKDDCTKNSGVSGARDVTERLVIKKLNDGATSNSKDNYQWSIEPTQFQFKKGVKLESTSNRKMSCIGMKLEWKGDMKHREIIDWLNYPVSE